MPEYFHSWSCLMAIVHKASNLSCFAIPEFINQRVLYRIFKIFLVHNQRVTNQKITTIKMSIGAGIKLATNTNIAQHVAQPSVLKIPRSNLW